MGDNIPVTANRMLDGGAEWVIGAAGKLTFEAGATVAGLVAAATFASAAEIEAGTEAAKVIGPDQLKLALAALPYPITMSKLGGFALGVLSSVNDTSGVAFSGSKTKAMGVYADTGGVALTDGAFVRAVAARQLIGTAITGAPNVSAAGLEGLLKFIASANMGGNVGGVMGHLESAGTLTLTGTINTVKAAVAAFLDLATGATIAAGTVVSAFGVNPANLTGVVKTGRLAIVHVAAPAGNTWDSLFDISGPNGIAAAAAGAVQDKFGVIYCDGVKYTFPLSRASS